MLPAKNKSRIRHSSRRGPAPDFALYAICAGYAPICADKCVELSGYMRIDAGHYWPSKNSFTLAKKPVDAGLVLSFEAFSNSFNSSRCLRVRLFGVSTSTWM